MIASILALAGGIGLAFCQWLVYSWTPVEATLGPVQKIFYMHLPLAIWAMTSFFLIFLFSILYLWKRKAAFDRLCAAAAELGVLFCGLSLASGIIWAKKSWGVWWTWDPRLTTALIMWFIYAGYLVIRQMDMPTGRKQTVCAALGIIAFLDVPLVFLSARIFRSIHPAVFLAREGGLEPEMKLTLALCMLFLGLLWGALLLMRTKQLGVEANLNHLKLEILSGERNGT